MRGVAYALTASVALVFGALTVGFRRLLRRVQWLSRQSRYGPPAYERPYREPVYQRLL